MKYQIWCFGKACRTSLASRSASAIAVRDESRRRTPATTQLLPLLPSQQLKQHAVYVKTLQVTRYCSRIWVWLLLLLLKGKVWSIITLLSNSTIITLFIITVHDLTSMRSDLHGIFNFKENSTLTYKTQKHFMLKLTGSIKCTHLDFGVMFFIGFVIIAEEINTNVDNTK